MVFGLSGCSGDSADIASRQRAAFESSQFCKKHACRPVGEDALDRGGVRRAYRIRDDDAIRVQLETWGTDLFSVSIGLYGQQKLPSGFQELVTEFFASTIPDCRFNFHLDIARRLSAIMEARPHRCGPWEVRSGRVNANYIVTGER
jgi:hypothetical protein